MGHLSYNHLINFRKALFKRIKVNFNPLTFKYSLIAPFTTKEG